MSRSCRARTGGIPDENRLLLALGCLALASQPAVAQDACDDLKTFFAQPPRIGEWAELEEMKEGKPVTIQVAFVGKEERGGQELYRMQVVSTVAGKRHIMQTLTPWDIASLAEDHETELVMKMDDQPAMIMPIKGDQRGPRASDFLKDCAKITRVGDESVTVPAGTFKAGHYKGPDGDTWVSSEVPGWRMVKMVTPDGNTVVLTATGSGAKNEITEQPMDMKALMRNPEAMKRMMRDAPDEEDK